MRLNIDGYVALSNEILLYLLGESYWKEVLSYWKYPLTHREVMDELIESNSVETESSLLSKQERSYFNYYLNKKEFTNGFDLRNKYMHGTNASSKKEHEADYYKLLKIIILLLLKIDEDLPESFVSKK